MKLVSHDPRLWQFHRLILITLLASGATWAQSESPKPTPGVEILKLKWEKQVRLPRNFDPSVIPSNSVFSTMESGTAVPGSTQAPFGDEVRRAAVNRSAAVAPVDYFPGTPARMPVFYVYSVNIRNVATRAIRAVAWDYLFINPASKTVVGQHQLLSYAIAKPGQIVTLKGSQRTRRLSVLSAPANTESKSVKTVERVVIQCVLYEDETTWRNPAGRDGVCELLKNNQPAKSSTTKSQPSKEK